MKTKIDHKKMTELFRVIKEKKEEAEKLEKQIQPVFENLVIEFFKEKGFMFETRDPYYEEYDPPRKYFYLPEKKYPNFVMMPWGGKSTKKMYLPPVMITDRIRMSVRFEWQKTGNVSQTKVYWHADKESLEDFYKRKLEKTFNLI